MLPPARFNELLMQVESPSDVSAIMHAKLPIELQSFDFGCPRKLIQSLAIPFFQPVLPG
jgi:hypothetical protein